MPYINAYAKKLIERTFIQRCRSMYHDLGIRSLWNDASALEAWEAGSTAFDMIRESVTLAGGTRSLLNRLIAMSQHPFPWQGENIWNSYINYVIAALPVNHPDRLQYLANPPRSSTGVVPIMYRPRESSPPKVQTVDFKDPVKLSPASAWPYGPEKTPLTMPTGPAKPSALDWPFPLGDGSGPQAPGSGKEAKTETQLTLF